MMLPRNAVGCKSAEQPALGRDLVSVKKAAALDSCSVREMYNRTKPGDPNFVVSQGRKQLDPSARRGIVVAVASLSPRAQERWRQEQLVAVQAESERAVEMSGQLGMFPKTEVDVEILNIPPGPGRDLAIRRFRAIQPALNHDFKALGCRSHAGLIRAIAAQQGTSENTIRRWATRFVESGGKIESLADRPPGPPPGSGTILDASMQAHLVDCWQVRKLSKMQSYRSLNDYLGQKQRALGASWSYLLDGVGKDFVSRATVARFIDEHLGGENNPWRRGGTAIKDAAGSMDRCYDEFAGDAWCIDEKDVDGIFYLPGKRAWTTRPYMISVIDERTTRPLGRKLVVTDESEGYARLDADAVLDLLEETIRVFGRPKFLVRDKGGHFRSKVGGRVTVRSHGEVIERAIGALGKLGVTIRSPGREPNPKANRSERLHRIYSDLARRDFGTSFCGANLEERARTGIDERIAKHKRDHCQLGICGPQLLSMDDAERITAAWVEEINHAPTQAKGCEGMTRLAAYNQFQPPEAERAARMVSDAELLAAFAEDYDVMVRKGGVIVIPGKPFPIRYSSAALVELAGKKRCVTRARHDKSYVNVFARPGEPPLRADRRVAVGLHDKDALSRESEKQARTRRILEQSARPVIDLSADWKDEPPRQEICGMEYSGEKMGLKKNAGVPTEPEPKGVGFADLE